MKQEWTLNRGPLQVLPRCLTSLDLLMKERPSRMRQALPSSFLKRITIPLPRKSWRFGNTTRRTPRLWTRYLTTSIMVASTVSLTSCAQTKVGLCRGDFPPAIQICSRSQLDIQKLRNLFEDSSYQKKDANGEALITAPRNPGG